MEIEITKVLIQENILNVKEQREKDLQKNKQHLIQLRITTLEGSKLSVILQSAWEVLLSHTHGETPWAGAVVWPAEELSSIAWIWAMVQLPKDCSLLFCVEQRMRPQHARRRQ